METQNLQSASDYINNLLLARGLLRNGKSIDFATPEADEGGPDATMARIINLVHDLVMRRDREAEQRENLAGTIRTLRSTEAKQTLEIERLQTKTNDLARSVALAEGQERAFKTTIRTAEATTRSLKEQIQRMKASIQQIRSQCANDLRKRDVEMQKLKSHLVERQRGKRDGLGVTTITITPPPKNPPSRKVAEGGDGLNTPGYSLRQETTEFLTQLCQNLSDENNSLIAITKNSIQTLKNLQGLSDQPDEEDQSPHQSTHDKSGYSNTGHDSQIIPPSQCEILAEEMECVLEQLRTLLTNPSFVPLEEVELRDNEISRLREGWEKMESRWREAVSMMDAWHKRISGGGASINIDELKQGMGLAISLDSQSKANRGQTDHPSMSRLNREVAKEPKTLENSADEGPVEASASVPTIAVNHVDTFNKPPSITASPGRFRRRQTPRDKSQPPPEVSVEEDEYVLVDKPNLQNVQQRRPRRRDSKISKKPSIRQTTASEKPISGKMIKAEDDQKKERSKKRSSSSRQDGQRTRRRTNSIGPTELKSAF